MAAEPSANEIERDVAFAVEAARAAGKRALALRKSGRWTTEETLADIGDQACDGFLQGLLRGRYPDDGLLSEETADSPARLQRSRCWIVDPLDGKRALALRKSGRWTTEETLADIGDQACDGYLQGLLRGRYPDDGVLSEETADSPARLQRSRCWIVDPLDGTREYSQQREDWAVHVALTLDHKPALAAVGLPSQGQVLWGVALPGRERGAIEGEGASELVRGDSTAPARLRLAISRSHTPEWTSRFAQILGVSETVPAGSAGYKVMLLLLGRADVYVHKRGLKEWDTCAPETVARALGWTVCKLRGEDHRYNQQDYRNHELVVCRPAHKQQVLEALAAAGALAAPS